MPFLLTMPTRPLGVGVGFKMDGYPVRGKPEIDRRNADLPLLIPAKPASDHFRGGDHRPGGPGRDVDGVKRRHSL